MKTDESVGGDYYYIVPGRTLRGSPEAMLAEIDETIQGLLALRQLIALRKAGNAAPAGEHTPPPSRSFDCRRARRNDSGKSP